MAMTDATQQETSKLDMAVSLLHALALAFVALGALSSWLKGAENWAISSIYLLLYVHMGFSIARKRFGGAIAWTWLLMIIALFIAIGISFTQDIMLLGQIELAIATSAAGPFVQQFINNIGFMGLDLKTLGLLLFLGFIGLNISERFAISQQGDDLVERLIALGAVLAIAIFMIADIATGKAAGEASTELQIVPQWYVLPYYAVLRAIPAKEAGVIIAFIFIALPLLAIFIHRCRKSANQLVFNIWVFCALASFIGLGLLGAQVADEATLLQARILMIIFVSYFIFGALFTPRRKNMA